MKNAVTCNSLWFLLMLLLFTIPVHGQYYSIGADPSSIRWNQAKVHQFRLIYPAKEKVLAEKFSGILNDVGGPVTASMKSDIRKMPVIIHPYVSFSNGVSILAPRRMELFPKQPLALETSDFAQQLIIHESRHFAQMERLNEGFTKAAGFILGEQAQSIVLGLHVPAWLLEGDAVLTETLLSHAGRGRIAGFLQPLRSRIVNNRDLSYDRVQFGSYRETLPDEYLLGYFLTARGRMLADPLVWSDGLAQIGRNPFNIRGLAGVTRPKTGYRFSKLYVETIDWLRDFWTHPSMLAKAPDGLYTYFHDSMDYRNYYRPQYFNDSEIICLKKSMGDIQSFVAVDTTGNERIIARPGMLEDAGFTYRNGVLVWAEIIEDRRWENRSWSDLFKKDLSTGKTTRLSSSMRFFSPVFNHTGDRLAVIEERVDGTSWVNILNATNGDLLESFQEPDSGHFSYVCWENDADQLITIITGIKGRTLARIQMTEKKKEVILGAGFNDITCPVVHNGWVYFTGPAGATQGLFRINLTTHRKELVFNHPEGINYLSSQGSTLFLSTYSPDGYRPSKISFDRLHGTPVQEIDPLVEPVTEIIQRAPGEFPIVTSDTVKPFVSKKYRKIDHLFRLHSWSPVFVNPDAYQVDPGLVFMSQNDLSTLTCWAGYQFNKTDLSHNLLASFTYTGFYPTLKVDFNRKYRTPDAETETAIVRSNNNPGAYSDFFKIESGVPLNFSSGAWNRKLEPALFFEYVTDWFGHKSELNASAWMAGVSVSSSVLRKMSYRDLFPKWGVSASLSYFRAFSSERLGSNKKGRLMLYLPGFLPNSSIRILNSVSWLTFNQFLNSLQDYPRGQYVYQASNRYNFKLDYACPISYPDYHLSGLIYVKRIKTDLFFDAGTGLGKTYWFMSTGSDLTIDYHIFRIGIDLESGIRMMYFPNTNKFGAEFLFGFSMN